MGGQSESRVTNIASSSSSSPLAATGETSADANAVISNLVSYHGVTVLSTTRTLTLPSAATVSNFQLLWIKDESGNCSGNNVILVAPNGTDLIDGVNAALGITVSYGDLLLIQRGGAWFSL